MEKHSCVFSAALFAAALFQVACEASHGEDGVATLTLTTDEAAGENCTQGGERIEFGPDENGDGVLDDDEVSGEVFACEGAVVETSALDPGDPNCPEGGLAITMSMDVDSDGTIGDIEGDTIYVCSGANGAQGAQGDPGADGAQGAQGDPGAAGAVGHTSLIVVVVEPPGVNCEAGGVVGSVGVDDGLGAGSIADDGILQPNEIDSTVYVCNGLGGEVATPTITPGTGVYESPLTVTLSTTTVGATIYYTTDGSQPTEASTEYTAPFQLTDTAAVRAFAVLPGRYDSAEAFKIFSIVHVLHVSTTGDDTTGDGSTSAPYATLEKAATEAGLLGNEKQIRVAAGTYALTSTVEVPSQTMLIGGYDEFDWETPDPQTNVVNLDSATVQISIDLLGASRGVSGISITGSPITTGSNICVRSHGAGDDSVEIRDVECIFAATGNWSGRGIDTSGSRDHLVEGNVITIAGGNNSTAIGMALNAPGTARGNRVTVSYSGRWARGMIAGVNGAGNSLFIYNNVVDAGSPASLVNGGDAIELYANGANSSVLLANNTIQSGTEALAGFVYNGVDVASVDPTATVDIANNIVFCRNPATTNNRAIFLATTVGVTVEWNNLFDCAAGLVNDGTEWNDIADVNATPYAIGNITFDLTDAANTYFVDESLPNFALQPGGPAGFNAVKQEAQERAEYTTDFLGTPRTPGWSMGAYEQDI